jgi:predicted hydrocarbon binding protein
MEIFKLTKEKQMTLAVVLANYAKRKLETEYDKLAETDLGQAIRKLNGKNKRALEFVMYLIAAATETRMNEAGFWQKVAKEIGSDAAPELAKRFFINPEKSIEFLESFYKEKPKPAQRMSEKIENQLDAIIRNIKKTKGEQP